VAGRIANLQDGQRKDFAEAAQICAPLSQSDAADMLNVSRRSVQSAHKVQEDGIPELIEAVEKGDMSVSTAAEISELPEDEQVEVIARGEKEIMAKAAEIKIRQRVAKEVGLRF